MGGGGQSAYAEMRGTGTLPPGAKWGDRALKPGEVTVIDTITLSRESLLKRAREWNARKIRVQLGVSNMSYWPEPGTTNMIGPDWHDVAWEHNGNIFDLDDAARQACH